MPNRMHSRDGRAYNSTPVLFYGKAAFFAAIPIALIAAAALVFELVPALRIRDGEGRTLAVIRIPDGRFVHTYVHTINLSPVDEYFRIEGGKLRLYELRYDTNSVGMPSDSELGFRIENNRYVLTMDRVFERIPLRVSVRPEHGIVANGEYFPFSKWTRPMGPLVLTGERALAIRAWR
jgi:hypothetical protein